MGSDAFMKAHGAQMRSGIWLGGGICVCCVQHAVGGGVVGNLMWLLPPEAAVRWHTLAAAAATTKASCHRGPQLASLSICPGLPTWGTCAHVSLCGAYMHRDTSKRNRTAAWACPSTPSPAPLETGQASRSGTATAWDMS